MPSKEDIVLEKQTIALAEAELWIYTVILVLPMHLFTATIQFLLFCFPCKWLKNVFRWCPMSHKTYCYYFIFICLVPILNPNTSKIAQLYCRSKARFRLLLNRTTLKFWSIHSNVVFTICFKSCQYVKAPPTFMKSYFLSHNQSARMLGATPFFY